MPGKTIVDVSEFIDQSVMVGIRRIRMFFESRKEIRLSFFQCLNALEGC